MKYFYKNLAIWLVVGLVIILAVNMFQRPGSDDTTVHYSEFIKKIENGTVTHIDIEGDQVSWQSSEGKTLRTVVPPASIEVGLFLNKGVTVEAHSSNEPSWITRSLFTWVPLVLLLGVWYFFMRNNSEGKGGGRLMSLGKSRARLIDGEKSNIKFKDVAGIEEAKDELVEIVDFLRTPEKYTSTGARIPTGVLLSGDPGTGKTLLAKAIAGEAAVPFYSISGSDFVEMYVGVGASRVRDLFAEAKKKEPCIIFIDEIDAVGRHRSAGAASGNDEREQTLNQLLVEMDGFEANNSVVVIAATNRPDILDPALKRPGRFDRQIIVPVPDVRGREHILKVHGSKVQVNPNVDWSVVAKGTPGFSGAELANMVNEAALLSVRGDGDGIVTNHHLDMAKDKVMMGAERRSLIITPAEKNTTAYHEAGHALVAWLLPGADPVHKVSIIPRGQALGITMQMPENEKYSHSRGYLYNTICVLLGGRVAEEIIFDEITTGAGNDIERATGMAQKMVCEWGMDPEIGPLSFATDQNTGMRYPVSEETALKIDKAVQRIIGNAYTQVREMLQENEQALREITQALHDKETIGRDDLTRIIGPPVA
ncbi:MAG: ATP-dependent metallopeptidase FtsH/Yme1/Tma family protein [Desulfobulbaceae bacterium]|uniref:ATP-dependent zinc metalloprotease FtsH n=1 Tax=Candidatus Desulfatifera sulfidica TaxID=2841691 RepID=A0A8J6TAW3_9BACT|nr:ATP-dependent metallopeptidase FtsH/Yme1/Tma family protein [Candidatus Desulfatifera sulfidica]